VASHVVTDRLARGLVELGHEVRYHLQNSKDVRLPDGIAPAVCAQRDEDILHINHLDVAENPRTKLPWVRSIHSDLVDQGLPRHKSKPNFIFVSQTMARLHKSDRFALNGIDPAEFIYSETKNNYFLFIVCGGIQKARQHKGLDTALWLAHETGIKLVVAGGEREWTSLAAFDTLCRATGAKFVGRVEGRRKAELFTAAKALLFPTRINEAFGLPVAEALMSGTPVIASDRGAMPELLARGGGFVCRNKSEYLEAAGTVGKIAPAECRRLALEQFHYLDMARAYVKQYEQEIGNTARRGDGG